MIFMQPYIQTIKNTVAETMTYRLNFVLWRVRTVLRLLILIFLWQALFANQSEVFGYARTEMMTYLLLSQVIGTVILATRTQDIGGDIQQGNLSNYLVKPMPYFGYIVSRDIADKLMNLSFAVVEFSILFAFLRAPIIFPSLAMLGFFLLAVVMGTVIFFCISSLLSMVGFWTQETWASRFVFVFVNEFLSGGLFPLDILPPVIQKIVFILPFQFLMYFPLKIYLGHLSFPQILSGFAIGLVWLTALLYIMKTIWSRGLKAYTAEGR